METDQADRTADLLALADVHRWSVIKMHRTQSVAEHSFATAVITMELAQRMGYSATAVSGMVLWALVHDAPETLTGDIDGKFKRDNPIAKAAINTAEDIAFPWYARFATEVPEHVKTIVKVADQIEALTFLHTWGVGPRADDVYRELLAILFEEVVPHMVELTSAGIADTTADTVWIVRDILHHSVSELNGVQLRRFRDYKEAR
jgi:5'-deoxynucleotidase YfbR-like HD superfamily hydrolase